MGLARAGASIVLVGRRQLPLETTVQHIRAQLQQDGVEEVSHRAVYYSCDITDYDTIPLLMEQSTLETGVPPTILVHNAGVNVRQPCDELTSEHWQQTLELQLTAPSVLTRAASLFMKEQNYGRIITIASLQSYLAFPNSLPYAAAKSGVLGLTRALAEAYSPAYGYANVTANAIAPGYVATELTKSVFEDSVRATRLAEQTILGRNSVPEDLVGACLFLASPASSYVTGQCVPVDGGFSSLGMR
jgi:gluconate 5-dehydrogenase